VGALPEIKKGNHYILTFQDDWSKFMVSVPICQQDAEMVAREFVTQVILKYGIPGIILTDQGTNFLSEEFKNTCKLLRMKKIQTITFHSDSNGGLERSHDVLAAYLRHYVKEDQTNWDQWVPFAMFVYNTTKHSAAHFTMFELVFGRRTSLPSTLKETPSHDITTIIT
jgi:transposase InsO family protein